MYLMPKNPKKSILFASLVAGISILSLFVFINLLVLIILDLPSFWMPFIIIDSITVVLGICCVTMLAFALHKFNLGDNEFMKNRYIFIIAVVLIGLMFALQLVTTILYFEILRLCFVVLIGVAFVLVLVGFIRKVSEIKSESSQLKDK
ncbi:MAG: hypothetical protein IJ301_02330 [Clostridia bacterium]|nr:hypothetical protein [Clostridia bacterium]